MPRNQKSKKEEKTSEDSAKRENIDGKQIVKISKNEEKMRKTNLEHFFKNEKN